MTGAGTTAERALRQRAIAEGTELFARHGEAAADLLTAKVYDPSLSPTERRFHRLARVEIERLGRERRKTYTPNALVVWRPSLLSWAGLAGLFRKKRPRR